MGGLEKVTWAATIGLVPILVALIWLGPRSSVSGEALRQDQARLDWEVAYQRGELGHLRYDESGNSWVYLKVRPNPERERWQAGGDSEGARPDPGQDPAVPYDGGIATPHVFHEQFLPTSLVDKYAHKQDAIELSLQASSRWAELESGLVGRELQDIDDRSPLRMNLRLETGDIIISVDGVPVEQLQEDGWELHEQLKRQPHHTIILRRGGQTIQKNYTVRP